MAHRGFGPDRWGIAVLAGILLASTARVGAAPLAASLDEGRPAVSFEEADSERFKRRARLLRVPEEDIDEIAYEQPSLDRLGAAAAALGFLGLSSALWLALRRRRFFASV